MGSAWWLFGVLWAATTAAPANPSLTVQPLGATLQDIDQQVQVPALPSGDAVRFDIPVGGGQHHYTVRRTRFEDLNFTLEWDDDTHQWRYQLPHQRSRPLEATTVLSLSRTVSLNTSPPDVKVYVDADDTTPETEVTPLVVDGTEHRVTPLPQTDSWVQVPNAWKPPPLYLVNPWFATRTLAIRRGGLDTDQTVYPPDPIELQPLYGPFCYPRFNLGLALGLIGLAVGRWLWMRPRWLEKQRRDQELVARIVTRQTRPPTPRPAPKSDNLK